MKNTSNHNSMDVKCTNQTIQLSFMISPFLISNLVSVVAETWVESNICCNHEAGQNHTQLKLSIKSFDETQICALTNEFNTYFELISYWGVDEWNYLDSYYIEMFQCGVGISNFAYINKYKTKFHICDKKSTTICNKNKKKIIKLTKV